ncbi:hypothetical protein GCM10009621_24900 [Corynebacterium felinum]
MLESAQVQAMVLGVHQLQVGMAHQAEWELVAVTVVVVLVPVQVVHIMLVGFAETRVEQAPEQAPGRGLVRGLVRAGVAT